MSSCFNPQFGGIFRTDTHPSLFSVAVRKYADIYMRDLGSLASHSPHHKFYPTQSIHMVREDSWVCNAQKWIINCAQYKLLLHHTTITMMI
jgi:hypothetical protein